MQLHNTRKTVLAVGTVLGFVVSAVAVQNALTALGVNETEIKPRVVSVLTSGTVPVSLAARAFKAAAPAVRPKLIQAALVWAKGYTESADFKADYERRRESEKPRPPQAKGSVDEELAKERAERRKNLDEMRKSLEKMTPEMRKSMDSAVKQTEEQFARTDSDPQMIAMMRQGIEMRRAADEKAYQERVASFEKRFPADSKVLIARRLQQFLEASKDVDYSAKLLPAGGGKMGFADPKYESKPGTWKICYRAGKESVEAARAFAQSWLTLIQAK